MTVSLEKLNAPDRLKARGGITFAMFYYLVCCKETPTVIEGRIRSNQNNLVYLLLTGESADDQYTDRLGCSRIASGERRIPPEDREDIAVNQDLVENIKLLRFSNENSIVQSLKTLFRLNSNLLSADEAEFIRELESKEYLAEVLRIAVKNSHQSGKSEKLTKEEKSYFDSIYNHVKAPAEITPAVLSSIDRKSLWQAGKHWYELGKKGTGRFSGLHICDALFPKAQKKEAALPRMPVFVQHESVSDEAGVRRQPLTDALSQAAAHKQHIYLLGEGGIGKTTAAFSILEDAYQQEYTEDCQIPLFVELSGAPDTPGKLYENGVSTFIRRAIYKQVCESRAEEKSVKQVSAKAVNALDEAFVKDPEEAVLPIEDLLSKETPDAPEYLLILDGLNECPRTEIEDAGGNYKEPVIDMIMGEINDLAANYPNVRILLTGRVDESVIGNENVARLELSGIDDPSIKAYLTDCGWSPAQIRAVFDDPFLVETLRIPLFLTLFAPLGDLQDLGQISTRGEIFRTFFHEREVYPVSYTMQNRLEQVERDVESSASARQRRRVTAKMQYFILDFVLPELAWHMVQEDKFTLDTIDACEIIAPLLLDCGDTDVCGKYGRRVFQKLRSGQAASFHTAETAKKFIEIFGRSMDDVTEKIFDLASLSLGVLTSEDGCDYRFLHQHIRDYFASHKVINNFLLAGFLHEKGRSEEAFSCLCSVLENPMEHTLLRFVGEALGEHRNAPALENGRWCSSTPEGHPLRRAAEQALDICRGRRGQDAARAVHNLIRLLTDMRRDLSGLCLDGLDLRRCNLNGVILSRPGLPASFRGAVLSRETLFPSGHTAPIRSVCFHPREENTVLTSSWDGTVKLWDASTGLCRKTISTEMDPPFARFSPDGTEILLLGSGKACLLNADSGEQTDTLPGDIFNAAFSSDGTVLISVAWDSSVQLWKRAAGRFVFSHTIDGFEGSVSCVSVHPKDERFLAVTDAGILYLCDPVRGILECRFLRSGLSSAEYSADGRRIILNGMFGLDDLWDADTLEPVEDMPLWLQGFRYGQYSPDGKKLLLLSSNNAILFDALDSREIVEVCTDTNYDPEQLGSIRADSRRFAVADGASVRIYDCASGAPVNLLKGACSQISAVEYSPDGRRAITAGVGAAKLWDMERGVCLGQLAGQEGTLLGASFATDGAPRAVTSSRGSVRLWDTDTGECLVSITDRWLSGPAVLRADGKEMILFPETLELAFADAVSGSIRVEDVMERIILLVRYRPDFEVREDGEPQLLTVDPDRVTLWDADLSSPCSLSRAEAVAALDSCDDLPAVASEDFTHAAFSPDGEMILTAQQNGALELWSVDLKTCFCAAQPQDYPFADVAFSPDGTLLATAAYIGAIRLFRVTGDRRLEELGETVETGADSVSAIAFHPDGGRILAACGDGVLREFDVHTGRCLHTLPDVPGLFVCGLDLSELDSHDLTAEDQNILRAYAVKTPGMAEADA